MLTLSFSQLISLIFGWVIIGLIMMYLNDTVQQTDIFPVVCSCEQRRHPVCDLLRHTLRTHTVVLQEQLDAAYKAGRG